MKINKEIVENLKNLAIINPQVKLTSNEIGHASEDRECILYWKWEQELKKNVPVYDMNYLLQILRVYEADNYENVKVEEGEHELIISTNDGKMKNTYRYEIEDSEIQDIFLNSPTMDEFFSNKLEDKIIDIDFIKSQLMLIKKQVEILNSMYIVFSDNKIIVKDIENTSSNNFELQIDCNMDIEYIIPSSKFNLIKPNDYKVSIHENAIVFNSKNNKMVYVIKRIAL